MHDHHASLVPCGSFYPFDRLPPRLVSALERLTNASIVQSALLIPLKLSSISAAPSTSAPRQILHIYLIPDMERHRWCPSSTGHRRPGGGRGPTKGKDRALGEDLMSLLAVLSRDSDQWAGKVASGSHTQQLVLPDDLVHVRCEVSRLIYTHPRFGARS